MKKKVSLVPEDLCDEVFTIEEAAKFFKTSKDAMYKRVQRKRVPFHKDGSRVNFLRSELTAYVRNT